ncbi:DUF7693 family protein [Pseudomonas cremoricolorata]|uniref:DUF7693 domain-containing protein n=1 Tax=Pseudomonas cremoricolorata TaxID=157783 RepID=A0A089WNN5_9PSED|nr:hypothetical protein [Pseudomonas cremoricolorata]AIR90925.1 hypothetical protein LK03_17380 [Pseudomonas cremoricolorata]
MYQRLRDAALGVHALRVERRLEHAWVQVDIDAWSLTLELGEHGLARCLACQTAEGAHADSEHWPRAGSDPCELLSQWERTRIEHLLRG